MLYEKTTYLDDFPINIRIARVEEYPIHYHKDIEFVYVLEGEILLKNGSHDYLLHAGEIFTNSGHEVHGLRATDKENAVAIIQVSNSFFTQYFPTLSKACFRTYVNNDLYQKLDHLRKMLLRILLDNTRKSFNYKNLCIAAMVDVINYLNKEFNLFAFENQFVVNFKNDNPVIVERMSRIINYIYENHAEPLTLDDLAQMEHLSTFHLSHSIREYIGITFQELLFFARAEMSEIDLLETNKKISVVGRESGFSTTAYYEKYFRKWFGHTPQEHRDQFLPQILSDGHPAQIHLLSSNEAVSLIKRCLSAVNAQETSLSTVGRLHLDIPVDPAATPIMEVGKTLKVVITLEDYRIMGSRLFAFLERLRASHIILAAAGADTACAEFTSLVEMLAAQGLDVTLSSQTPLEGSPAYGRDSIAAVPHIFEEHFLSKEDFVSCRLRDQGDPRQILKGEAALLTSNLIAKPAFYAYWLLSSLKGRLLAWSKYYSVVAVDQDGAPTYILTVMNFNDEIQRLCLRNASIHETDDVIHRFRDELNLDFTLPLPPGNYMVVKYALENENSIFHYMSQLGFPEECPLPDQWSSMFCTHPRTHGDLEQVTDVLNVSFTLQGAGMQIAIIQRAEGAAYDWM